MTDKSAETRVLILYYSFTNQTHRVAEAMAEAFRESDCDVTLCQIEFIDERYKIEHPFRPVGRKLFSWLQLELSVSRWMHRGSEKKFRWPTPFCSRITGTVPHRQS